MDKLYPFRILSEYRIEIRNDGCSIAVVEMLKEENTVLFMNSREVVKLFANTFLAFRIVYFKELDTYVEM